MSSPLWSLYLDAAGDPGWVGSRGNSDSPLYIVAGPALTPEANADAKQGVNDILSRYVATPHSAEIKYTDLAFGDGVFSDVPHDERVAIKDEINELLEDIDAVLFGTILKKQLHQERYGDRARKIKPWTIQNTVDRFDATIEREGGIGQVVMDAEELETDRRIQRLFNNLRVHGTKLNPRGNEQRYLDNLIDTVTFAPSEMSAGIQLADYVARAIWESLVRDWHDDREALHDLFYQDYEPAFMPRGKGV